VVEDGQAPSESARPHHGGSAVRGRFSWQAATAIGVKLATAVESAHNAHILHGDIKPASVLFSEYGEPRLTEFGAAPLERPHPRDGDRPTAAQEHAPPEILAGGGASVPGDIYSLASTLFTMISGRPPFAPSGNESVDELLQSASTGPPSDLRLLGVPDRVAVVLERALAPDPDARPSSAGEFARALQDARSAAGQPQTDVPTSHHRDHHGGGGGDLLGDEQPRRGRPRGRIRRRWVLLLAAAVVLLGAGGAVYFLTRPQPPPSVALYRLYDPGVPDRYDTTLSQLNGYVNQEVLGYLLTSQGGQDARAIYSCLYGQDHFVSPDQHCEGYMTLGQIGWAYITPPSGFQTAPLYRCVTSDQRDHFVSNDPYCEGQSLYGLLGYALQSP
jgi:serine/threonine protein kinase